MSIYKNILDAITRGEKLFAVLIDPDKFPVSRSEQFIKKVKASIATHIFVGGSTVSSGATEILVQAIKKHTHLPIVLFPGDVTQITDAADALLFLSLLSGRNPEYLIGKHVEAVSKLRNTNLEVIPTGYILIESGKETMVSRVTHTEAISRDDLQIVVDTAKAGELLGMQLMYLEGGSGAKTPITKNVIESVKNELNIPLIVGGGIRSMSQIEDTYSAGADIIVVGTAFEEDDELFEELKK
ncbi:putative glycerol-1-phosphate prenyltransferase [Hyunsoonleella jejuensis]|uniref:Geranylgeranylglyceryl phosphate synthase n=1 Tax=Hyunsoonleella jejuensis TaxID=419940 RepID=A0A1H9BUE8_9FLAO|nr:geranylgeranylglyceryl/heptaprenylglyceryl phosphate synthase [Hyunsoonleella jejuensis]SEP92594.1 putative glycerol-1-phosphate prenyltransferase [Hyunsoonleella jejuensis]